MLALVPDFEMGALGRLGMSPFRRHFPASTSPGTEQAERKRLQCRACTYP
jgi:hypothetical protein